LATETGGAAINSEIRISKSETNPKPQIQMIETMTHLGVLEFELRIPICFGFCAQNSINPAITDRSVLPYE
jgi:hypothetical protein